MERKRRLPPVIDRLPGNPIGLFQRGNDVLMDERDPPGGPARVGEWVTLAVAIEKPDWSPYEYVGVEVTAVEGDRFRGTLRSEPFDPAVRDRLQKGAPFTFAMDHVFMVRPVE